ESAPRLVAVPLLAGLTPGSYHCGHRGRSSPTCKAVQSTPMRVLQTSLRPCARLRLLLPSQDPAPMPGFRDVRHFVRLLCSLAPALGGVGVVKDQRAPACASAIRVAVSACTVLPQAQ